MATDGDRVTPERFVAIDLETTGLDPDDAEILELGAVQFVEGDAVETFSALVRPAGPIPPEIQTLTGIVSAQVAGCPPLEEVLPHFRSFVGDTTMVGHNIGFDLSFLEPALAEANLEPLPKDHIDTLLLAKLLFPTRGSHSLAELAALLEVHVPQSHRAAADARTAGELFLVLARRAGRIGKARTLELAEAAAGLPAMSRVFRRAAQGGVTQSLVSPEPGRNYWPRLRWAPVQTGDLRVEVRRFLEPDGPLAKVLPSYEPRREQVEMAARIVEALELREQLVVEAGTGVGKTLAYLVPCLLWSHRTHKKVVVSTRTKNLQEQIFRHDLPLLRKAGLAPVPTGLLKGMGNYLCLKKYHTEMHRAPVGKRADLLLPVVAWVGTTRTGDLEEGQTLLRAAMLVAADPATCTGARCPYRKRCFFFKARRRAQESGVVVVNHPLLVADLTSNKSVLGSYSFVVVDEAHALEQAALEALAADCGPGELDYRLQEVARLAAKQRSLLKALTGVSVAGPAFFELVQIAADRRAVHTPGDTGRRFRFSRGDEFHAAWMAEALALAEDVRALSAALAARSDRLLEGPKEGWDAALEFQGVAGALDEWRERLEMLAMAEEMDRVYWCEQRRGRWRLIASPVDVSAYLSDELFGAVEGGVCCSATLQVANDFDFFEKRVGLSGKGEVIEACFGSPFPFPEHMMAIVAAYLPSPSEDRFHEAVSRVVETTYRVLERGPMVLFTSHSLLRRSRTDLAELLNECTVLAQGLDGSRVSLQRQFAMSRRSILLGTDSFWEGVDLPGEALEFLVLTKLPFPVPSDPVIQAQAERVEARGGNGFEQYMLPRAVVKFRQGIGRLIRSKSDRGVVILLDHRLLTARYGRVFLDSLPVTPVVVHDEEALAATLLNWKQKVGWD